MNLITLREEQTHAKNIFRQSCIHRNERDSDYGQWAGSRNLKITEKQNNRWYVFVCDMIWFYCPHRCANVSERCVG